jgi:hypothetical protein
MTFSTPDYPSGLTLDNGQACDPPAGIRSGEPGKCNNGFQIYGVGYEVYEIVPGGDPLGTLVYRGTDDVVYLNQFGGFVAIDGDNDNTFVQANIATSPEPATWFLLATGMLGGGMALRRNTRPISA